MAGLVGDAAEVMFLQAILGSENLWLRLNVNDRTPADADLVGHYTEMSTHGYAAKSLVVAGWSYTQGGPSRAEYGNQAWVFTAAALVNVYGYYVVGQVSGALYWAERFPGAPFPVQVAGDEIDVTARLALRRVGE